MDLSKQLRAILFDEERYAQKYLVSGDTTYFTLFLDQSRVFQQLMDSLGHQPADTTTLKLVQEAERRHNWHFALIQGADAAHASRRTGLNTREEQARTDTLDLLYKNFERSYPPQTTGRCQPPCWRSNRPRSDQPISRCC